MSEEEFEGMKRWVSGEDCDPLSQENQTKVSTQYTEDAR